MRQRGLFHLYAIVRRIGAAYHEKLPTIAQSNDHDEQAESLFRLGEYVADNGMEGEGDHRAARDLLMAIAPRLRGETLQRDSEPTLTAAVRIALDLDQGVFPVQGPPGAGKTYTGARMICALARDGKRIGITANSHKVIRNLLDEVIVAAAGESLPIHCIQKVTDKEDNLPTLQFTTKNEAALDALRGAACAVGGGTSFFWARPDARLCVDVLFIDEAAQMSLADVLAVSQAAESIVLLGDPRADPRKPPRRRRRLGLGSYPWTSCYRSA